MRIGVQTMEDLPISNILHLQLHTLIGKTANTTTIRGRRIRRKTNHAELPVITHNVPGISPPPNYN